MPNYIVACRKYGAVETEYRWFEERFDADSYCRYCHDSGSFELARVYG